MFRFFDEFHAATPISALIQGGASAVDTFAKAWGRKHPTIERYECRADWDNHGRAAGPVRNARMLEWKPDIVIAFAGGRGTADMVRRAKAAGIRVVEVE